MSTDQLISRVLPPPTREYREGFSNNHIIDSLSDDERQLVETELIRRLRQGSSDSLILETLAYMKSEQALPALYEYLDRTRKPGDRLITASSIFQIREDEALIEVAQDSLKKIERQWFFRHIDLISSFQFLAQFDRPELNESVARFIGHKDYLVSYNAGRSLVLCCKKLSGYHVKSFFEKHLVKLKTNPGQGVVLWANSENGSYWKEYHSHSEQGDDSIPVFVRVSESEAQEGFQNWSEPFRFNEIAHGYFQFLIDEFGFQLDRAGFRGSVFYELRYGKSDQVVSISYEVPEDYLIVTVSLLKDGALPEYGDTTRTLHISRLTEEIIPTLEQTVIDENTEYFSTYTARNELERKVLKAARDLRLCLQNFDR